MNGRARAGKVRVFVIPWANDALYWAGKVGENENGVMRLNGVVYPVVLNRETDPVAMDRAWSARISKLQTHGGGAYNPVPDEDAQRPDHWWTFRVVSSG